MVALDDGLFFCWGIIPEMVQTTIVKDKGLGKESYIPYRVAFSLEFTYYFKLFAMVKYLPARIELCAVSLKLKINNNFSVCFPINC